MMSNPSILFSVRQVEIFTILTHTILAITFISFPCHAASPHKAVNDALFRLSFGIQETQISEFFREIL
jgi:hypothetical protein